jgi:RNA polymerase sigma-70 factor, ECF subfamily
MMPRLIRGGAGEPPSHGRHDELRALAEAVQAGSSAALATFVRAIVPHLIRVVRRVLGAEHPEVEDVAQEAALAVLDGLRRFRGEGTVLHFACRVGVPTATNTRRREVAQKRQRVGIDESPDRVCIDEPWPDQQVARSCLVRVVRELLDTLPENQAQALALHAVLGCTVSEIAEMCGVPTETVRSRLRLAKLALRKQVLSHPILRDTMETAP